MYLSNYYKIIKREIPPIYQLSKETFYDIELETSESNLWETHKNILNSKIEAARNGISFLDLKIELVRLMLTHCNLCERRCSVNRLSGEVGHCGVKKSRISTYFSHFGEEADLVPSFTIFFAGCTFNCVFCQNYDISQNPANGAEIPEKKMAEIIDDCGCRNINWVGGDPTSNLYYILNVLKFSDTPLPHIWNSNMYCSNETLEILKGIIDLYLTDFKYGNNECGRLSNVKNYFEIVSRNHLLAREFVNFNKLGRKAEMIIRHLVVPNHINCCSKKVLDWILKNLDKVNLNIMEQYRPMYKASEFPELNRRLTRKEFLEVLNHFKRLEVEKRKNK